jgi:ribonucleoside-diphosphate reductase alpha chain
MAYDMDCKGVTVYRDGSRDNQVLSTGATDKAKEQREASNQPRREEDRAAMAELRGTIAEKDAEIERLKKQLYEVEAENLQRRAKRSRPDKLRGTTIRKETPLGTMFVNITEDDKGQPFEVFLMLGKAGGSAMADAEAMGRLISLALRSGIPVSAIHKQLRGISSDRAVGLGPNKVLSLPDAIGIAIEEWHRDRVVGVQQELLPGNQTPVGGTSTVGGLTPNSDMVTSMTHQVPAALRPTGSAGGEMELQFGLAHSAEAYIGTCPDCGSQMEYAEGCVKCHVCGFSECG